MNPYKVLGARPTWKTETIKRAYRKLSKKHHPDVGGDEEKFKELSRAWAILRNSELRKKYDETGIIDNTTINSDFSNMVSILGKYIASILENGIQGKKDVDIIKLLVNAVQQDSGKIKSNASQIEKEITALTTLKDRISRAGDKRNLFYSIVDQRLQHNSEALEKIKSERRAFDMLLEELGSYSCSTEIVQAMRVWTIGTTSATGA